MSKIFHKHLQEKIALRIKLTKSRRIFPSWRFNSLIPKVDHILLSQQQKKELCNIFDATYCGMDKVWNYFFLLQTYNSLVAKETLH